MNQKSNTQSARLEVGSLSRFLSVPVECRKSQGRIKLPESAARLQSKMSFCVRAISSSQGADE